jgi:hypothetical protein
MNEAPCVLIPCYSALNACVALACGLYPNCHYCRHPSARFAWAPLRFVHFQERKTDWGKLSRSVQLSDYALWVIRRFENPIEGFGRICMQRVALRDANRAKRAKAMSRTRDHPMHAPRPFAKLAAGLCFPRSRVGK